MHLLPLFSSATPSSLSLYHHRTPHRSVSSFTRSLQSKAWEVAKQTENKQTNRKSRDSSLSFNVLKKFKNKMKQILSNEGTGRALSRRFLG